MKLGRIPEFDERSKNFPVRTLFRPQPLVSKSWDCPIQLNQGNIGACVGFSWAHKLASAPLFSSGLSNEKGVEIYHQAQKLDHIPGENYEGTSVLAGVKAVRKMFPGSVTQYRWAFGLNEVLQTLSYVGPVVLGLPWYESMFEPDSKGNIKVSGMIAGGHAILCRAIYVELQMVRLHNSWGNSWGLNGDCFLTFVDLGKLLKEQGEACIVLKGQHVDV